MQQQRILPLHISPLEHSTCAGREPRDSYLQALSMCLKCLVGETGGIASPLWQCFGLIIMLIHSANSA